MRIRIILLLLFCFSTGGTFASPFVLNWRGIKTEQLSEYVQHKTFTFDGAYQANNLPSFQHKVRVSNSENIEWQIEDMVFEDLSITVPVT